MSTSSTPYWPGDTNPLYFQNLAFNSTNNLLTLTPFGNSVTLDTPTAVVTNGVFSTVTVSSIGTNVNFTGNVNLLGTNAFFAPNVFAAAATASSITLSSITGMPNVDIRGGTTTSLQVSATGGTNNIQILTNNAGAARIYATGTGLDLSTIKSLNGGIPVTYGVQPFNTPVNFQTGYSESVPNLSTILFVVPFSNDNVCVTLTPTNKAVSAGNTPNLMFHQFFGNNGNGVSSIGFEVDARDNGNAYSASFFWIATSL